MRRCPKHETDGGKTSGSDPFLPDEIIIEILSWLSVEALLRLKCVCKSWCATIKERNFIEKHMNRSKIIQEFEARTSTSANEKAYQWQYVVDGLVLEMSNVSEKYRIRNPSTKQTFDLPNPFEEQHLLLCISMVFLSISNNYKVVYIYRKGEATSNADGARVLTIGTDRTWRSLDIPPSLHNIHTEPMFVMTITGVHYLIGLGDYTIICLEMDTESSISVRIPKDLFSDWKNIQPLNWEEKLALASVVGEKVNVRVLENYKKQEWADREIVITLNLTVKGSSSVPDNLILLKIKGDWLWINANDERLVAYNMRTSRVSEVYSTPPGQKLMYTYRPSLVHLKGMTLLEN